jgi:GrpB-like predicted nucleotidyltransferase (UPF0157 family)
MMGARPGNTVISGSPHVVTLRAMSSAAADWLAGAVEHIGSTAVVGMPAKPVVDMLAPVRSLAEARAAVVPALAAAGWLYWPDDPCRTYRLWFLRPRPDDRTHHLHVIEHGDPHATALCSAPRRAHRDAVTTTP